MKHNNQQLIANATAAIHSNQVSDSLFMQYYMQLLIITADTETAPM